MSGCKPKLTPAQARAQAKKREKEIKQAKARMKKRERKAKLRQEKLRKKGKAGILTKRAAQINKALKD